MSLSARIWARAQRTGSGTRKLLLLTLAENADDSGLAVVTMSQLAREAEVTERCVQITLRDLERAGFLDTETQFTEGGKNLPNRYRLPYG